MKRFYFIFLPVVLVFLYSIPGVFCLSGGGEIASSSLKKNYYYCNPGGTCLNAMKRFYFIFSPVVLVFLYSIPILYCVPNVICIGEPV